MTSALLDIPERVLRKITDAEIVSFDLFETLIGRPLAEPTDLHLLMQLHMNAEGRAFPFNFQVARRTAENLAHKRLPPEREECTFDDIYQMLAEINELSDAEARRLQELEATLEFELAKARPIGRALYEVCCKLGKRMIFTSDIYLPEPFIRRLLDKCGYDGTTTLYLSNSLGLSKRSGSLFRHILAEQQLAPGLLLHVGNNPQGDENIPRSLGILTERLRCGIDAMKKNPRFTCLFQRDEPRTLQRSLLIHLLAERLFDNPFSSTRENSHFGGDAIELGYAGLGPVVADFCLWIHRQIKEGGHDAAFFAARDNRIVQECYELLFPQEIRTEYVYGSRRFIRSCTTTELSDLLDLLGDPSQETPASLFWRTMSVDLHELNARAKRCDFDVDARLETEADCERFRSYVVDIFPYFREMMLSRLQDLRDYCDYVGMSVASAPVFVEIGYAGTLQEGYAKVLGTKLTGLYFFLLDAALPRIKRGLVMRGYVGHLARRRRHPHPIMRNTRLLETLFCTEEASILHFCGRREDGGFEVDREAHSPFDHARIMFIRKVHEGCRILAADMASAASPLLPYLDPKSDLAARLLQDFIRYPEGEDAVLFEGIAFTNIYGGEKPLFIVPPRDLLDDPGALYRALWKEGTVAFCRWQKGKLFFLHRSWLLYSMRKVGLAVERRLAKVVLGRASRQYGQYRQDRDRFFAASRSSFLLWWGRLTS
ncbi:hypothetical protein [Pleomorphomonas carboxyditropha]|uniref:Uncharacterized protein n=1 Tax=Pleomorphomonas carboxyditropha TaxID=2023338 RepID=A0A2G9WNZ5_9HYPH|nr:hypothetical protein [Pleomorphomonas carboxyditropha]PIO96375.1 hypothetical protein CJ014_25645 [Pleomorphomonas carboxyditropha]